MINTHEASILRFLSIASYIKGKRFNIDSINKLEEKIFRSKRLSLNLLKGHPDWMNYVTILDNDYMYVSKIQQAKIELDLKTRFNRSMIEIAQTSSYKTYCDDVHGRHLMQMDFLDKDQFDLIFRYLSLDNRDHLLDIGCGLGGVSAYLSSQTGCICSGIDKSPEYVEFANSFYASNNSLLSYSVGDLNSLTIQSERYSHILLIDSFCFAENTASVIRSLAHSLKRHGKIVFVYTEQRASMEIESFQSLSEIIADLRSLNFEVMYKDVTDHERDVIAKGHSSINRLIVDLRLEGHGNLADTIRPSANLSFARIFPDRKRYIICAQR